MRRGGTMKSDHILERNFVLNAELTTLQRRAREKRDAFYGATVTYSPKVFIPLTQLCRDVCHYCTFAKRPKDLAAPYMSVDEVLEIAHRGEAAGCVEALLTLGEKPELRYVEAVTWLEERGFSSTVDYLHHICEQILQHTTLIPHINSGTLNDKELSRLKPVSASMGLMLESSASQLIAKGGAHYGSPDKLPFRRWRTLARAGRQAIPMTTGLLIGIGESRTDRVRDLLAIARLHTRFGNIQEVIIQNFRAKEGTGMANAPEPGVAELSWTIAVARLILPVSVSLQVPPNLNPDALDALIESGLNDWGGVSPVTQDFVNPEAPWPSLDGLRESTAKSSKRLTARLPVYPPYLESTRWFAGGIYARCLERSDSLGLVRNDLWRAGADDIPRVGKGLSETVTGMMQLAPFLSKQDPRISRLLGRRLSGVALSEYDVEYLFSARELDTLHIYETADELRRQQVGDKVTYVVNRNINYTNVCQYACTFCAFSKGLPKESGRDMPYDISLEEIQRRTIEAWDHGATEVCLQGGIHPRYTGEVYESIVRAVKDAVPAMHVHAFSPLEINQGARSLSIPVREYLLRLREAGLRSLPGTAAEILHDDVRQIICPDKLNTKEWLETMRAAHAVGLRSTATIMFGHIERPRHWARHLTLVRSLQCETQGFTEFVPLPFVAAGAPIYRRGQARPGPTLHEAKMMHAVARIILGDVIPNLQVSWVKMGMALAIDCLHLGVNDLGGTLMNESISRSAGANHGQHWWPRDLRDAIMGAGREPCQRSTDYSAPHLGQALKADGAIAPLRAIELTPAVKLA